MRKQVEVDTEGTGVANVSFIGEHNHPVAPQDTVTPEDSIQPPIAQPIFPSTDDRESIENFHVQSNVRCVIVITIDVF
jgi:hypothetical protein